MKDLSPSRLVQDSATGRSEITYRRERKLHVSIGVCTDRLYHHAGKVHLSRICKAKSCVRAGRRMLQPRRLACGQNLWNGVKIPLGISLLMDVN